MIKVTKRVYFNFAKSYMYWPVNRQAISTERNKDCSKTNYVKTYLNGL